MHTISRAQVLLMSFLVFQQGSTTIMRCLGPDYPHSSFPKVVSQGCTSLRKEAEISISYTHQSWFHLVKLWSSFRSKWSFHESSAVYALVGPPLHFACPGLLGKRRIKPKEPSVCHPLSCPRGLSYVCGMPLRQDSRYHSKGEMCTWVLPKYCGQ